MTAQAISGPSNLWIPHGPLGIMGTGATTLVMDASTEGGIYVGRVFLPARSGSKTISSAGGKLQWLTGSPVTFADAGTALRIGIQDLSTSGTPGRGDGTFDVYADLVGGTDSLSAATWTTTAMESGTKTLTHGDLIAIVWDMSTAGGSDAVRVAVMSHVVATGVPYCVAVTAGPAYNASTSVAPVVIEFDDGTFGYIDSGWVSIAAVAATSFNSGTTPDEYCNIFRLPFPATVDALYFYGAPGAASSDFELILYSDPLGTPAAIETIAVDASQLRSTGTGVFPYDLLTPRDLAANTDYAIAVRPTTANNVGINYFDVSAAAHMGAHPLGTNCYIASRSNQTGAFSGTTTRRMVAGVRLSSFDDAAGGAGGGMVRHPGMTGGLSA